MITKKEINYYSEEILKLNNIRSLYLKHDTINLDVIIHDLLSSGISQIDLSQKIISTITNNLTKIERFGFLLEFYIPINAPEFFPKFKQILEKYRDDIIMVSSE